MKKVALALLLSSSQVFAGADLLLQKTGELDKATNQIIVSQKQLKLDDPFLIQFYGQWKASGKLSFEINNWANMLLDGEYEKAAHLLTVIEKKSPDNFKPIAESTKIYLYWKLGLANSFITEWIKYSSNSNFLESQMGMALDQAVGNNFSQWLIKNGVQLTPNQRQQLAIIEKQESKVNYSLQAWASLRTGDNCLKWIGMLDEKDPLRFYLAQSVVVDYANKGKLGDAAKLLKQVYEPKLVQEGSIDQVSSYYMLLARLLYQAGAMNAASDYYKLIPAESKQFLQARVENIWISLRKNDMPELKGELASLKLDLFKDQFLPEVYLVNSIANLKLCQFENVQKSFDAFISDNSQWAKKINMNLNDESPAVIEAEDFYLKLNGNANKSLALEYAALEKLANASVEAIVPAIGVQPHWKIAKQQISFAIDLAKKNQTQELRRRWANRKRVLEAAIRKMRFVKVEFISMMRRFANKINPQSDKIRTIKAAPAKGNIEFPFDGIVWGDEVFNMTAEVKSMCLSGE